MQGTITWVGDKERTYQTRNGQMMSRKIGVLFNGPPPEGLPADCYRQDGSIFGEISYKTKAPAVGQSGDMEIVLKQFPSGDPYVAFKRTQAPGVPMNGNGSAKPQYVANSKPLAPQLPQSDKPTTLEMLGRLEGAWDLVQDMVNRRHPQASEDCRLECTQKVATTLLVEWLRDHGVQMSGIYTAGYTPQPSAQDADESIPF